LAVSPRVFSWWGFGARGGEHRESGSRKGRRCRFKLTVLVRLFFSYIFHSRDGSVCSCLPGRGPAGAQVKKGVREKSSNGPAGPPPFVKIFYSYGFPQPTSQYAPFTILPAPVRELYLAPESPHGTPVLQLLFRSGLFFFFGRSPKVNVPFSGTPTFGLFLSRLRVRDLLAHSLPRSAPPSGFQGSFAHPPSQRHCYVCEIRRRVLRWRISQSGDRCSGHLHFSFSIFPRSLGPTCYPPLPPTSRQSGAVRQSPFIV